MKQRFKCSYPGCDFEFGFETMEEFLAGVDEHYDEAHADIGQIEDARYDRLKLSAWDLDFLEGLRISAL